ncbi:MAG: uncharacterized protein JWM33_638 [Caulobacteraceae bacterium]|nr:uncharacterized protein [Caulobacteraceae bacterium]
MLKSAVTASNSRTADVSGDAVLIVAHPGHELKVLGWVAIARPTVLILTDGSGHDQSPRTQASRALLKGLGCRIGRVFGHASDRRFYEAMLDGDKSFFLDLLERLTDSVLASGASMLIGDAAEGYNPTHDLCRVLIDAVAIEIGRVRGRQPANYAICLTDGERRVGAGRGKPVRLALDDLAHGAKLAACCDYHAMRGEVDRALAAMGDDRGRTEMFWPVTSTRLPARPHYHTVGRTRVANGVYAQQVRFEEHIAPIATAILDHVHTRSAKPTDPIGVGCLSAL